jgi:hypothetical protein
MDTVSNEEIVKMCNTSIASDIVRYRRLRWLGHVAGMDNAIIHCHDDRLPKIMMLSTLEGAGRRGRPVKCWNDYVRKELDNLGLSLTWWRRCICQDRPSWKAVIETLLSPVWLG